ncbi:MAG: VWA domain-containing protein [Terriglobales bacterium]
MLRITGKQWTAPAVAILFFLLILVVPAAAQQTDQKQNIPDAPSASRPPQPFPTTPPAEPQGAPPSEAPTADQVPGNEVPPSTANPATPPATENNPTPPPHPLDVKTVPEGGATPAPGTNAQDELFKITRNVNQVIVPVRVTDDSGRLVSGLLPKDFSVYEDGKNEKMNFFTSDPLAISAAVIFDLGMSDINVQKVNQTFPALEGAFSQFDEVAIYTYSGTVGRVADFGAVGKRLDAVLNQLKTDRGENNGVPVLGGPLGPEGPTVNNVPYDRSIPPPISPPKQAHVLNDAILAAALDLGQRERTRRKIIFVISDGKEYRSTASYGDVLKVLLSNGILVYGLGVGSSAIPGYKTIEKLHLPGQAYGNILPRYANATGGEILSEYSKDAIENAYQRAIGDARNQYTLGYATAATPSSTYREIEVKVGRPGCKSSDLRPCVLVYAKAGYYPLPVGR